MTDSCRAVLQWRIIYIREASDQGVKAKDIQVELLITDVTLLSSLN